MKKLLLAIALISGISYVVSEYKLDQAGERLKQAKAPFEELKEDGVRFGRMCQAFLEDKIEQGYIRPRSGTKSLIYKTEYASHKLYDCSMRERISALDSAGNIRVRAGVYQCTSHMQGSYIAVPKVHFACYGDSNDTKVQAMKVFFDPKWSSTLGRYYWQMLKPTDDFSYQELKWGLSLSYRNQYDKDEGRSLADDALYRFLINPDVQKSVYGKAMDTTMNKKFQEDFREEHWQAKTALKRLEDGSFSGYFLFVCVVSSILLVIILLIDLAARQHVKELWESDRR